MISSDDPAEPSVDDGAQVEIAESTVCTSSAVAHAAPVRLAFAVQALERGDRYGAVRAQLVVHFGISVRTAERDLVAAYAEVAAEYAAERPVIAARIGQRAWRLALRAEQTGDTHGALAALALVAKVAGLEKGLPHEPTVTGSPHDRFILEALHYTNANRIAEIENLRRETGTPPVLPPGSDTTKGIEE